MFLSLNLISLNLRTLKYIILMCLVLEIHIDHFDVFSYVK